MVSPRKTSNGKRADLVSGQDLNNPVLLAAIKRLSFLARVNSLIFT
jgi:hypothetical protein